MLAVAGLLLAVSGGPASRTWSATAKPSATRFGYTATLLLDGDVLVTGDYDYDSLASAELYAPGSGS